MTHGITYLPKVDKIVVLKNGMISEQGTYSQLMENKGEFNEFLLQYLSEKDEEELDDDLEGKFFLYYLSISQFLYLVSVVILLLKHVVINCWMT